jgi:hypothetical protein
MASASHTASPAFPGETDDIEPFRVHDEAEALRLIEDLRATRAVISVHDAGNRIWPAHLCEIAPNHDRVRLQYGSASAPAPHRASLWTCRASVGLASIRFDLAPCDGPFGTDRSWWAQWPVTLYRFQRRQHLRLEAPVGSPYAAAFTLMGQDFELPVSDLSIGGIGLRASPQMASMFYAGRKLPQARLQLGADHWFVADLEVRLARRFQSKLLGTQLHLGCRFMGLSKSDTALLEQIIQRLTDEQSGWGRTR